MGRTRGQNEEGTNDLKNLIYKNETSRWDDNVGMEPTEIGVNMKNWVASDQARD